MLNAATPREQAEGLIRLANTALQYVALIAASNYATSPFKDGQVSYRFERLKRPFVSEFAHFLRIGVPTLQAQGTLFVSELAMSVEMAQREQVHVLRMGERGLEERKLPLFDALANLRNALAHEKYRGQWEALVAHHVPLVLRFLQIMEWCAKYPLLRLVGDGHGAQLMGSSPTFTTKPIPDAAFGELARAQQASELTGLLLADPTLTRFLTLYPFMLWADCPYCAQEPLLGLTEEVFLFNGDEGRRYVSYVGVRHTRPLSEPKAQVEHLFADKEVPPELMVVAYLTYPVLYDRAHRQSETWLRENIAARRYIPQVYYPRKEMEAAVEAFLRGPKGGFLLLGEAGIGKTNLLCRKVEEWCDRGEVVLFYAGHQLSVEAGLEERLMRDLHLTDDFLALFNFLCREGRQLMLVVDGINEHENPPALLKHLCAFVARYASASSRLSPTREGPRVKAILSFRTVFFQKTLQALFSSGGNEASLFPLSVFQTHSIEEQGRMVETYRFALERVDEEELEAMYEGYRAYEGRAPAIVSASPSTRCSSICSPKISCRKWAAGKV